MIEPTSLPVWCLSIIGAFFAGSLPTGYLMGRLIKNLDVREHGSGNLGATNVMRVVGVGPGIATLAIDILKGAVPVLLALRYDPRDHVLASFVGLSAISGHNWTPFLGFRGGKGVATSIGVFLALIPQPALLAILAFFIALLATRYVSLSSLIGAAALTVSTPFMTRSITFSVFVAFAAVMVFALHRKNIARLKSGEEPRFAFRKSHGS